MLKVYCETSFVSWLVSRPSTNPDHAVKQAYTRKWWDECAPRCELFASGFVIKESAFGDADQSALRLAELTKFNILDGEAEEISTLKTASVIAANGYECPKILTPKDALEVEYD